MNWVVRTQYQTGPWIGLCGAITEEGYEVIRTSTPEDGLSMVQSDPSYSAILLDWDLERNTSSTNARR